MTHKIFIIIPKINNDGPIKGAFALANQLYKRKIDVSVLVSSGDKINSPYLNKLIDVVNLSNSKKNLFTKIIYFRKILNEKLTKFPNIKISTISFCLEADIINAYVIKDINNICSMRANIFEDYKYNYGIAGYLLARTHFLFLRKFKNIIAMHSEMKNQIKKFYAGKISIINNFIDEDYFSNYSINHSLENTKNIIFVGKLSERKNPTSVLNCFSEIILKKKNIKLDIVGDGPLRGKLQKLSEKNVLSDKVIFHGHIDNPYSLIQEADVMILPSYSEGTSRAILEALYFGVVCVIRDMDGSKEISKNNHNIFVFSDDKNLSNSVETALNRIDEKNFYKQNFLQKQFRQECCLSKYMDLINE